MGIVDNVIAHMIRAVNQGDRERRTNPARAAQGRWRNGPMVRTRPGPSQTINTDKGEGWVSARKCKYECKFLSQAWVLSSSSGEVASVCIYYYIYKIYKKEALQSAPGVQTGGKLLTNTDTRIFQS